MSRFPAGFFEAIAGEDRAKQADRERECLLSDMHHNLHRGEKCPECGYTSDTE